MTPSPARDGPGALALRAGRRQRAVEVLARYAQVIDNRDWAEADLVFAPDVPLGRAPVLSAGVGQLRALIGDAPATHGHNTTDVILGARPDGTVRAWGKFYIVRGDGTVSSGDYQDTLVRTPAGWRIGERDASRGNRLDSAPTGRASTRTLSFASWLQGGAATGVRATE